MGSELKESPQSQELVEPPYMKFTLAGDGTYSIETNMGPYWQYHVLVIAKKVKQELT